MRGLTIVAVAVVGMLHAASAEDATVRLGTEGAYKPFNYLDSDGNLAGFDIDIGNALCAEAKLRCEWIVQDWDGLIPGLLAEKFDAVIASMAITDKRQEVVDFTEKYQQTQAILVAATGSVRLRRDAEGNRQGSFHRRAVGDHPEDYVRDNFGDVAEITAYDTVEQAYLDLVAKRIDFYMGEIISVKDGFLRTDLGEGFAIVGDPVYDPRWHGAGAGIAVRKGDDALRQSLNAAIQAIRADGTYRQINDKYFDFDLYGN